MGSGPGTARAAGLVFLVLISCLKCPPLFRRQAGVGGHLVDLVTFGLPDGLETPTTLDKLRTRSEKISLLNTCGFAQSPRWVRDTRHTSIGVSGCSLQ